MGLTHRGAGRGGALLARLPERAFQRLEAAALLALDVWLLA